MMNDEHADACMCAWNDLCDVFLCVLMHMCIYANGICAGMICFCKYMSLLFSLRDTCAWNSNQDFIFKFMKKSSTRNLSSWNLCKMLCFYNPVKFLNGISYTLSLKTFKFCGTQNPEVVFLHTFTEIKLLGYIVVIGILWPFLAFTAI